MIMEFVVRGEELIQKEVKKVGGGGMVYAPKAWLGRKVALVLLPEKKEER